ncbi:MAG: hypothetical protein HYX47_01900 [Burkholderiales bacterium]|nr:hypothetical protein [Burkholderiales bacterium]
MKKETLDVLDWLASHAPELAQLLIALIPVLALLVVGYALHVILKLNGPGKKK